MKKYTQSEFDEMPIINGWKMCPTGDYTNIKDFVEQCRFGRSCSFGESCRFGGSCSFGRACNCEFGEFYHMISCGGFGSEHRTTYFFGLTDGGIGVRCGCFAGTLQEWKEKVKSTYGDDPLGKAYMALVEPVKIMMEYERGSKFSI